MTPRFDAARSSAGKMKEADLGRTTVIPIVRRSEPDRQRLSSSQPFDSLNAPTMSPAARRTNVEPARSVPSDSVPPIEPTMNRTPNRSGRNIRQSTAAMHTAIATAVPSLYVVATRIWARGVINMKPIASK
jgi:hypothetical protein